MSRTAAGDIRLRPYVEETTSRDRVVEVATDLFVHRGYKATSMKAIADQLGISPPAIYWHFSSKQDLFLTSMRCLLDKFLNYVEAQITADTPIEQLRQFVSAHVTWKLNQKNESGAYTSSLGMRDIIHELPHDHQSILIERQRTHLTRLRDILENGSAKGTFSIEDVGVTSFAIVSMCEYVVTWYDPEGCLAPNQVADMYSNLAAAMVTAR